MSDSFVEFAGQYAFIRDDYIIIWMRSVLAEGIDAQTPPRATSDLRNMFTYWRTPEVYIGPGCFCLRLDEYLGDEETRTHFMSIMKRVLRTIGAYGEVVPSEYLNRVDTPERFDVPDQSAQTLIKIMTIFIQLIGKEDRFDRISSVERGRN